MSFKSRDVRHFIGAGVALGVDVNNGVARVTIAAFSRREQRNYSRKAARHHINLRFDADDSVLQSLGLERYVYSFPYRGDRPRADILDRLQTRLSDLLNERQRTHGFSGSITEMRRIIREHAVMQRNTERLSVTVPLHHDGEEVYAEV